MKRKRGSRTCDRKRWGDYYFGYPRTDGLERCAVSGVYGNSSSIQFHHINGNHKDNSLYNVVPLTSTIHLYIAHMGRWSTAPIGWKELKKHVLPWYLERNPTGPNQNNNNINNNTDNKTTKTMTTDFHFENKNINVLAQYLSVFLKNTDPDRRIQWSIAEAECPTLGELIKAKTYEAGSKAAVIRRLVAAMEEVGFTPPTNFGEYVMADKTPNEGLFSLYIGRRRKSLNLTPSTRISRLNQHKETMMGSQIDARIVDLFGLFMMQGRGYTPAQSMSLAISYVTQLDQIVR